MMTPFVVLFFLVLSLLPQSVKADETSIKDCLMQIETHWSFLSGQELTGRTRHQTDCTLKVESSKTELNLQAAGHPLYVQSTLDRNSKIQFCKVDKEKLHLVFERSGENAFERKEKVQITLLKKQGSGLSLIFSQRQQKVLNPTQMNNLICHLNR